jgi:hypothetical protein
MPAPDYPNGDSMTTTDTPTETPDGTMLPFAMDDLAVWHKRPADDTWGGSEGGNQCATVCGQQIASTRFANTDPRTLDLVDSKATCINCFPPKES